MTDAVTKACPGCCGNTERGHLENTGVGAGKRRSGRGSLGELLLPLKQEALWREEGRRTTVSIVTAKRQRPADPHGWAVGRYSA